MSVHHGGQGAYRGHALAGEGDGVLGVAKHGLLEGGGADAGLASALDRGHTNATNLELLVGVGVTVAAEGGEHLGAGSGCAQRRVSQRVCADANGAKTRSRSPQPARKTHRMRPLLTMLHMDGPTARSLTRDGGSAGEENAEGSTAGHVGLHGHGHAAAAGGSLQPTHTQLNRPCPTGCTLTASEPRPEHQCNTHRGAHAVPAASPAECDLGNVQ